MVSVCVPSGLHAEVGTQVAAAGKHLVVEKPIDVTLAAADRLIDAARAAGVAVTVISQHRFDPGLDRAAPPDRRRRPRRAGARRGQHQVVPQPGLLRQRGLARHLGLDGGSLMNQGVHYVDLLRWAMGPVTEVTAI